MENSGNRPGNSVQHQGIIVTNEIFSFVIQIFVFWTSNEQSRALLTWSQCGVTCLLAIIWNNPWWRSLLQLLFTIRYDRRV